MTKLIALDAGHGLKTAGKQTPDGIKEWTLNDYVRDHVVKLLKDYDVNFIFPDNDEGYVDESLLSRYNKAYVNYKADVLVSIHHNAYTSTWNNATGVEVFTDKNPTAKDTALAKAIYKNLPNYTGLRGRGIKKENWLVINQNKVPAVLVEGGFMDSRIDHPVITSKKGQEGYAKAVAEGLIEFLQLTKKSSFFPKKGYFSLGDRHEHVGEIAAFMYKMFPSYTPKAALGNYYGVNIKKAITEFQKRTHLEADGCVGPITLAELKKYGFDES